MDRLNKVHRASRVLLPDSVTNYETLDFAPTQRKRLVPPILPQYVGILCFVTCGIIVIAVAGLLAFSIR